MSKQPEEGNDYGELIMEVTPQMAIIFKEEFNLEIEMMQGEKELLPNGNTRYTIRVFDDQKNEIIKEFCLKIISKSHTNIQN